MAAGAAAHHSRTRRQPGAACHYCTAEAHALRVRICEVLRVEEVDSYDSDYKALLSP